MYVVLAKEASGSGGLVEGFDMVPGLLCSCLRWPILHNTRHTLSSTPYNVDTLVNVVDTRANSACMYVDTVGIHWYLLDLADRSRQHSAIGRNDLYNIHHTHSGPPTNTPYICTHNHRNWRFGADLLCRLTISAGVGLVRAVSAILSRLTLMEQGPS